MQGKLHRNGSSSGRGPAGPVGSTTRRFLQARLGADHPALDFALAVATHLAPGPRGGEDPEAEARIAARVVEILRAIDEGRPGPGPAEMAGETPLLASFFQNADLLAPGGRHARAIGLLLNRVVERSGEDD